MNFGEALIVVKDGRRIARSGWNGKGMHVYLEHGAIDTVAQYRPYLMMFTAQHDYVPWVASQTDILANDWEEV